VPSGGTYVDGFGGFLRAAVFADGSLDRVFIDADDAHEGCLADIRVWWPKLKVGGLMLGHDFLAKYGVPRAVREAFGSPDEVSWGEYPIRAVRKSEGRCRV
jgi:predicted O-methyltransferase YrrM